MRSATAPGVHFGRYGRADRERIVKGVFHAGGTCNVERRTGPTRFCRALPNRHPGQLIGRRNMLIGLWAGARLGFSEESRAIYAMEVMAIGLIELGPDDIADKICRDFTRRGVPITRGEILVEISKNHRLVTARYAAARREEEAAL
jgi:hypothetical protein